MVSFSRRTVLYGVVLVLVVVIAVAVVFVAVVVIALAVVIVIAVAVVFVAVVVVALAAAVVIIVVVVELLLYSEIFPSCKNSRKDRKRYFRKRSVLCDGTACSEVVSTIL
jgi:hypothetical protein